MHIRKRIALPILLLIFAATGAAQQARPLATLELEDLMKIKVPSVYGASKFTQSVIDAPAAVSIVTAREIEIYGYRTLADILQTVPGFNITNDRNYSYVGVRGFQRPGDYNSRVLVTVDGHRINDPVYDMAYLGTEFPLDLALIERVEVIRGPSSSVYGTNAFFAVVNVVTMQGAASQGTSVSAEVGNQGTTKVRGAFSTTTTNGVGVVLSVSRFRTAGQSRIYFSEFDDPSTDHGFADDLDADRSTSLFGSMAFKGFVLQAAGGSRRKTVPTASFESTFNDPRLTTTDAQGWVDLRYTGSLAKRWHLTGRAFYDRNNYDGRYPSSEGVFADYAHVGWWGTEGALETTVAQRHRLTAAAEYRNNFKLDQGGFDLASGAILLDDRRSTRYSALSIGDQFAITDRVLIDAGVRTDWYEAFDHSTNPRLALIVKPAAKTAIKALWGRAFRAPNAYERFYSSAIVTPNPDLRPETIRTAELVVERYVSERYRLVASVYSSRIQDLISQIVAPTGMLEFVNLDFARSRGAEAEVEGKWTSGVGARLSVSYQRATNATTGEPLVNSARHLATANVTVPLWQQRLIAGVDIRYAGAITTIRGGATRPFVVPNLTLTARNRTARLLLSASAYNLFNQRYASPASDEHRQHVIDQNGRTFRFGFTWRYK